MKVTGFFPYTIYETKTENVYQKVFIFILRVWCFDEKQEKRKQNNPLITKRNILYQDVVCVVFGVFEMTDPEVMYHQSIIKIYSN